MSGLGIRREDKSEMERRTPLVPRDVRALVEEGVRVVVQSCGHRAHTDQEYRDAGAEIAAGLESCATIVAVKEIPATLIERGKSYLFFSHTIKGQAQNMPLLARILQRGCTLIDYERITDEQGRRLIGFGHHAGLAGTLDTLWALGRRLAEEGHETPFARLRPAWRYDSYEAAREAIAALADEIRQRGLPAVLSPLTIGIVGTGRVAQGAQEICNHLPLHDLPPEKVGTVTTYEPPEADRFRLRHVVFREADCYARKDGGAFDLAEYYESPDLYECVFRQYLPHLSVLINTAYWDSRYPRLVTRDDLRQLWSAASAPRLRMIGDLSCDVDGALASSVRISTTQSPTYLYRPSEHDAVDAWSGPGPLVLAVDNLPCELPLEASAAFSEALLPFARELARAQRGSGLDPASLSPPLRRATIVSNGELTPAYRYLQAHLPGGGID